MEFLWLSLDPAIPKPFACKLPALLQVQTSIWLRGHCPIPIFIIMIFSGLVGQPTDREVQNKVGCCLIEVSRYQREITDRPSR